MSFTILPKIVIALFKGFKVIRCLLIFVGHQTKDNAPYHSLVQGLLLFRGYGKNFGAIASALVPSPDISDCFVFAMNALKRCHRRFDKNSDFFSKRGFNAHIKVREKILNIVFAESRNIEALPTNLTISIAV